MAYELLPEESYELLPEESNDVLATMTPQEILRAMPWGQRQLVGAGASLQSLWEGVKQFAGKADPREIELARIAEEEAPVGAIATNATLAAIPFGMVGPSLKAAGAVGAGLGALQPVSGPQTLPNIAGGKAQNIAIGGASGAAGQALANKAAEFVSGRTRSLLASQAQNATKDATTQEVIAAGYKLPPSMMPTSGVVPRTLEGLSGKYKTNQAASIENQKVTNTLARRSIGLGDNEALSVAAVEGVRRSAYKPYEEIANLPIRNEVKAASGLSEWSWPQRSISGFDPKKALEGLKQARSDAKTWFESYNRSANPEHLAKAREFDSLAKTLDEALENYAGVLGRSDLVPKLREARKLIAKTYTIERAMKKGSGDVDAKVLGRLFEKRSPLSDGLDTIGKFGATFGDVASVPKSGFANPFTAVDFMQMSGTGPLGMIAAGHPLGAAAAAIPPLSRVAARAGILSAPVQRAMATPDYTLGAVPRITGGLLQYSPIGTTALAFPSLGQ